MMRKLFFLFAAVLFAEVNLHAQDLYMPRNIKKAVQNGTRSLTGAPGPNYWQNQGVYNIDETIHPDTKSISGKETIKLFKQ